MENKPIIVLCTTPDMEYASKIAQSLVEKKLAACCNILPGITSVYTWKGNTEQDNEHLLIIKTKSEKFKTIEDVIKKLHPYEVPEIIALDITAGSENYLKWISENVR